MGQIYKHKFVLFLYLKCMWSGSYQNQKRYAQELKILHYIQFYAFLITVPSYCYSKVFFQHSGFLVFFVLGDKHVNIYLSLCLSFLRGLWGPAKIRPFQLPLRTVHVPLQNATGTLSSRAWGPKDCRDPNQKRFSSEILSAMSPPAYGPYSLHAPSQGHWPLDVALPLSEYQWFKNFYLCPDQLYEAGQTTASLTLNFPRNFLEEVQKLLSERSDDFKDHTNHRILSNYLPGSNGNKIFA